MLCAPITGQKAAIEALKGSEPQVQDMVEQYSQRRRVDRQRLQSNWP